MLGHYFINSFLITLHKYRNFLIAEQKYGIYIYSLLPEAIFPLNFEIKPKIGPYRLPTHRRGAHRKFFP